MGVEYLPNSRRKVGESDEQWLVRRARIVQLTSNLSYKRYIRELMTGDKYALKLTDDITSSTYLDLSETDTRYKEIKGQNPNTDPGYSGYTPLKISELIEAFEANKARHEILVLQGDRDAIIVDIESEVMYLQLEGVPQDPF